ncbi:MAG: glycosyltransferase family 4 protein [bacterium]
MNILIISQTFWPDTVATSQAITDVAVALSKRGHRVKIATSRHNYEDPKIKYPGRELFEGIKVIRLKHTDLGKRSLFIRMIDFLSFNFVIFFWLIFHTSSKTDLIISQTSPPLMPVFGIFIARIKGIKFLYWTMDLQPELSVVSGLLGKKSIMAKLLQKMGDYVFHHADRIITLDGYMADHIFRRVGRREHISVVPIWPMTQQYYDGKREDNPFVRENGLAGRFVVMYAGNHSVVHPLTTLLDAASSLKEDDRFLFVHIGGGFRLKEVAERKEQQHLENIRILPFQPREKIHFSLGAADLQVVIMGEACVGLTHPNKIYGALYLGKPVLYIGPPESHVTDILRNCPGNIEVRHGESNLLVQKLLEFISLPEEERKAIGLRNRQFALEHFDTPTLIGRMVDEIEGVGLVD